MKKCIFCNKKAATILEIIDGNTIPLCEFHFREMVEIEETN